MKTTAVFVLPVEYSPGPRFDRESLFVENLQARLGPTKVLSYGNPRKRTFVEVSSNALIFHPSSLLRRVDVVMAAPIGGWAGIASPFSSNLWATFACFALQPKYIFVFENFLTNLFLSFARPFLFPRSTVVRIMDQLEVRMRFPNQDQKIRVRLLIYVEERIVSLLSDKIVVLTNFAKLLLQKNRGIAAEKILVIPQIIRIWEFRPDSSLRSAYRKKLGINEEDQVLIFFGSIGGSILPSLWKLVKAAAASAERLPKLKLLITGRGEKANLVALRRLAEEAGCPLIIRENIPSDDVPKYLSLADVGINVWPKSLSHSTIFGSKVPMYMAAGLPVLIPNLGGPREFFDGNGLIYEPDDVEDLSKKIIQIFSMDLKAMGLKSQVICSRVFSEKAISSYFVQLKRFLETRA